MLRRAMVLAMVALAHPPLHAAQSDPIDAIVRAEMASQRIPGMAVAVIRRGEVIKAQGYGLANVEHNVPVTDRTIFQSGSLGKQFTATVVMLQVQDGRVSLSDPIAKYFDQRSRHRGATSPFAICSRTHPAFPTTTTASSITARTTAKTSS